MTEPTSPLNRRSLSRVSVLGVSLSIGGIALVVILWLVLGNLGLEQFPRLFISLCLPPAVMAGLIGGYILLVRPR